MGNIKCISESKAKEIISILIKNFGNNIPYISGAVLNCILNNLVSCCFDYAEERNILNLELNHNICYNGKSFNLDCLLVLNIRDIMYFIPNIVFDKNLLPDDFFLVPHNKLHDYYVYYYSEIVNTESELIKFDFKSLISNGLNLKFGKESSKSIIDEDRIRIISLFYNHMISVGVSTPQNVYYQIMLLETLFSLAFKEKAATSLINHNNVVVEWLRKSLSGADERLTKIVFDEDIQELSYDASKKIGMSDDEFRTYNTFVKIYNSLGSSGKNDLIYFINHN